MGSAADLIIPPAAATRVVSGDTPEWEQALAAHHHALVEAGVTAWADEGKKLAPRRPGGKGTAA